MRSSARSLPSAYSGSRANPTSASASHSATSVQAEGDTVTDLHRDGVRISYDVHGDADSGKLPLLLTHGFSASAQMWAPNMAALSAERPVIRWDMRGHGRSDSPANQAEYTQAA